MAPSLVEYANGSPSGATTFNVSKQPVSSTAPPVCYNGYSAPPSHLEPKCHPLERQTTEQVDGFFLQHWPFRSEKEKKKFVAAGFSRVTCLYFPEALDDRIHFACRLLTILFLIDDLLEDMSFEEGSAYNERLIPIARGEVLPDRNVPVEWIMYDLWESMRAHDRPLADDILEPTFTFMRAQTDKTRLSITGMGPYLVYREKDVGKALLCALMRFSMALTIIPEDLASVQSIEQNCAKHLSVVNDILSWDKEYHASQTGHHEGSALCSSVKVLADETALPYTAAKNVLWAMCREWEVQHAVLVEQQKTHMGQLTSDNLMAYVKALEYQMSGNEFWSKTTLRYNAPTAARISNSVGHQP